MATKQIAIRFDESEYEQIKRRADEELVTMSEYLKAKLYPMPDKMLSLASGGKYPPSVIRLVLQAADEVSERSERAWSSSAVEWLSECSQHLQWLSENPWHPESYERTVSLLESLPESVKDAIKKGVGEIL